MLGMNLRGQCGRDLLNKRGRRGHGLPLTGGWFRVQPLPEALPWHAFAACEWCRLPPQLLSPAFLPQPDHLHSRPSYLLENFAPSPVTGHVSLSQPSSPRGLLSPPFSTDGMVSFIFPKKCFVCMSVLYGCYVYRVRAVPVEARAGVRSPGTVVIDGDELSGVGDAH